MTFLLHLKLLKPPFGPLGTSHEKWLVRSECPLLIPQIARAERVLPSLRLG